MNLTQDDQGTDKLESGAPVTEAEAKWDRLNIATVCSVLIMLSAYVKARSILKLEALPLKHNLALINATISNRLRARSVVSLSWSLN
jgi:hypothetical protein